MLTSIFQNNVSGERLVSPFHCLHPLFKRLNLKHPFASFVISLNKPFSSLVVK